MKTFSSRQTFNEFMFERLGCHSAGCIEWHECIWLSVEASTLEDP